MRRHREGEDLSGRVAVCILTGHGLKDPDTALKVEAIRYEAPADVEAVARVLGWA